MSSYGQSSMEIATYLSDSEDESLFCVKKMKKNSVSMPNFPFNKRLIRKHAPWTPNEKQRLLTFLKHNFALMEKPFEHSRSWETYVLMAGSIKSKNYAQCRLYHSQLLKRHGNTEKMIQACEREVRRGNGSLEKMQQYGLRVEVEEREPEECGLEESELWTVLDSSQRSYYQNGPPL